MRGQRLLRRFPRLWRATRLARRWYYARYDSYPDWQQVLQSNNSDVWRSARGLFVRPAFLPAERGCHTTPATARRFGSSAFPSAAT